MNNGRGQEEVKDPSQNASAQGQIKPCTESRYEEISFLINVPNPKAWDKWGKLTLKGGQIGHNDTSRGSVWSKSFRKEKAAMMSHGNF